MANKRAAAAARLTKRRSFVEQQNFIGEETFHGVFHAENEGFVHFMATPPPPPPAILKKLSFALFFLFLKI